MELGDLPFPFIVKEQTQETFRSVNRAQTSYTLNNKKYTFQGEVGQVKPDFVCTAEYFL